MKILALETSTEACSVALRINDDMLERFEIAPSQHSSLLLPMIESLLQEAGISLHQLDGLGFSAGPGSFTGLRIAAGVIQGIAAGADLPVVAVSTLESLALYAYKNKGKPNILAAMDARKNEVYWGMYRYKNEGYFQLLGEECVCLPASVPLPDSGEWYGIGPGWTNYTGELTHRVGEALSAYDTGLLPRASCIAELAQSAFKQNRQVAAEDALPVYIRNHVADKKLPT